MKKTDQKTLKLTIPGLIIIFLLILASKVAFAQLPTRTFTLVPPAIEHALNPGQTAEGVMKVINDADGPLTFTATVQDFIVEDPNGIPNILPPNTLSNKKYSAASWIAPYPGRFTVQPHERFELNYYLQIPADAKPGGHYAAVIFKPDELIRVEGTGAAVNTQVGTLFYINVNGDVKESARVTKFSSKGFQEYGPVQILTQIQNLGDLHVKPIGYVTVSNLFGKKVATLALPEHNIFPEAIRNYENTFNQKFLFGPYQARLVASYGKANNLPLVATMTFWVLPWKIMLVIVLVIVAIVLLVMYWKKRKSESKKETPQE